MRAPCNPAENKYTSEGEGKLLNRGPAVCTDFNVNGGSVRLMLGFKVSGWRNSCNAAKVGEGRLRQNWGACVPRPQPKTGNATNAKRFADNHALSYYRTASKQSAVLRTVVLLVGL